MPTGYRIENTCLFTSLNIKKRLAVFQNQKLLNAKVFENERTGLIFIKKKTEISKHPKVIFFMKPLFGGTILRKKVKNLVLFLGRFKKFLNEFYVKLILTSLFLHKLGKSWKDFRIN